MTFLVELNEKLANKRIETSKSVGLPTCFTDFENLESSFSPSIKEKKVLDLLENLEAYPHNRGGVIR